MPPTGKELLQYMTERAVRYFELPKTERKQYQQMRRSNWQYHWFGMMPFSFRMMREQWRRKQEFKGKPKMKQR